MASFIRIRADVAKELLRMARELGAASEIPASEMATALILAGSSMLSSGMDEEQYRAIVEQVAELTAPLRRATEERWKRTGFQSRDPSD